MHVSKVIAGYAYGPYVDKDHGRRFVTVHRPDGSHGSMTWARWLMQEHLGRVLLPDEHVDHVDEDPLNDAIENLQLLTPSANTKKAAAAGKTRKGVERGWSHGTTYGWMKKHCRCDLCEEVRSERNRRRRTGSGYGLPAPCGTVRAYKRGCKCDLCRAANAKAVRTTRV